MATQQVKAGVYMGLVTNLNDPEKRGRVKCIIPDVLGIDNESAWCEPCVNVAYDNYGDFCLPKLKETVWIVFVSGDPNRPVYLGGWWKNSKTPFGDNYSPNSKTRIISYEGASITMTEDNIRINVKAGSFDLEIKEGNVNVEGNLTVSGNVKCNNISCVDINASGSITASGRVSGNSVSASTSVSGASVTASGTVKGNSVTATNKVSADSVSASTITADSISADDITAKSSLKSNGSTDVKDLNASGNVSCNSLSVKGSINGSLKVSGSITCSGSVTCSKVNEGG